MAKKFMTERQMNAGTLLKDGDYRSIREVIQRLNKYVPDNQIFAELDSKKELVFITASQMHEEVMNLGDGLIDAGLKDAHIAIVAENSMRYVMADICISSGVGVVVPLDKEAPAELLSLLLNKCDADAIMCSSDCLKKVLAVKDNCPRVRMVVTMDKKVEDLPFWDEIVAKGESLKDASIYRNIELDLDAPAKIIFTSGTTGANKGVVLTNANLAANMLNCMDTIKAEPGNLSMSVLPMHHAIEINSHIMTRVGAGRLTYINGNIRNLMTNIKIFKPDTITIVPMIANVFYKTIWANVRKAGKEEKLKKGIKISNLLRKFGVDKTHTMFADVYAPFGGKLSMIVCGGAMLNPVVVKGMNDLGIRMENGYGITECGPLVSMNADTLNEHLSVGKPCPGLEAKILNPDENGVGELCIKGASVSRGYYKDEEATMKAFSKDGYFNTGDSAFIGKDGRIFLVGRKKNTIILENGKNVSPEEIENQLETVMDYVNESVVLQLESSEGNVSQKLLSAALYISDEETRADRERIEADIRKVNAMNPSYKAIEYVELMDEEFDKTTSRKIKRTSLPAAITGKGIFIV